MPLDSEESNRVQTVNLQSKPSNSMDGDDDNGSPKPMDLDVPSEDKPSEGQLRESTVNEQTRRPIHYTTLLFLPHIPFNTFKRDLVSVFSTSPYFLRLAVLDPVIMPDTKSSITDHDQIFGTIKNAIPKILLKRMGWASFASQYKDDTTNKWITVDLTAIRSKLIQHAIDCDAPSDLIDCLRLSRPIIEHLKVPHSERARNTGYLFNKLLSICPTRIRSKALVRRHLVIAAHVIYQLDKARGLWSVDCNTSGLDEGKESRKSLGDENKHSHEVLNAIDDGEEEGEEGGTTGQKEKQDKQVLILNKSSETTVHSPSYQGRVTETDKLEQSIDQEETMGEQMDDSELKDSFRQKTHQSSLDEKQLNDVSMNSNDHENKNQNRNNTNLIDPGDDLIKAANILNNIKTINPFLQGLTDFLVDEGSAEEELLLMGGMQSISFQPLTNSHASLQSSLQLQKFDISSRFYESDDSELLVALDRLILYLRIVHSVDFYAPALYMNEDLMPHPCHLMHIRPSVNEITKALAKIKGPERTTSVESVDQLFASQLKRLVRLITPLTENDCKGLGFRSVEEVVEDFIKLNTRRKKRKTDVIWVCPLSNKKFRDPIYVKKHILNKHMDKIEAIKKDNAYFFNNYLMDPARPQLPSEPRFPRKRSPSPSPSRETVRESSGQNNRANERERSVSWTQGSQRWQQYGRSRNDGGNFGGNYGRDNLHSSVPYYPRPYGRQQYSNFRMPYGGGNQRSYHNGPRMGNGYSNFNRRGFPRRSYIDLDAP
ncbi:unnamed protein product [Heterobilharzia americana]|nr:unnamed protein product [Heterobilharzia americana]